MSGSLRFCPDSCCHESYREDQRVGVFTLPQSFARANQCMYCTAEVPTNAELRAIHDTTGVHP